MGTLFESTPRSWGCNTPRYYYRDRGVLPTLQTLFPDLTITPLEISPALLTALTVSSLYAMRIKEMMQLTNLDVLPGDRVLCRGAKGSNSYIIYLPGLSPTFEQLNVSRETFKLFPWSYMQFYRGFLRAGVLLNLGIGKNTRVSHASRYIMANLVAKIDSTETVGQILHHRSVTSASYYIK